MLTRRVRGREFLLSPSPMLNRIVRYVLAVKAKQYEIAVHAVEAMSNHWHLCVSDEHGNVVNFQRDCHSTLTKAINVHFKGAEAVWAASTKPSRVSCQEPDDLIARIAYTIVNPVEAGLVRFAKSWPGVSHSWPCRAIKVERPPKYFRGPKKGGKWPDSVELELSRPPDFEHLSDEELSELVNRAIAEREKMMQDKFDKAGKKFIGRYRIRKQSRHSCSSSPAKASGISPEFACANVELLKLRLTERKQWRMEYTEALTKWRETDREVEFPFGTYQMRVLHAVNCAPPLPE